MKSLLLNRNSLDFREKTTKSTKPLFSKAFCLYEQFQPSPTMLAGCSQSFSNQFITLSLKVKSKPSAFLSDLKRYFYEVYIRYSTINLNALKRFKTRLPNSYKLGF